MRRPCFVSSSAPLSLALLLACAGSPGGPADTEPDPGAGGSPRGGATGKAGAAGASAQGGVLGEGGGGTLPGGGGSTGPTGGSPQGGAGGATIPTPDELPLPPSHRAKLNFNLGWKFIRMDVPGAEAPAFDDTKWSDVSTPHTFNDGDTYAHFDGDSGETQMWTGKTWYRKHFTLPPEYAHRRVFVEFEGVRQRAHVYLNGAHLGMSETGFVPFGFDLTAHLKDGDNVLAVMCDNTFPMNAEAGGKLVWHDSHWHPNFGGITRDVYLHVTDDVHVTLPLYSNLQTTGIYLHADNVSDAGATVVAEVQIKNESQAASTVQLAARLLDATGAEVLAMSDSVMVPAGQAVTAMKQGMLPRPHLWEPASPYLYTLQTTLTSNGTVLDATSTPLGVRTFRFDKATGFWINGKHLKLHGWGQKPTNSWGGLGAGVPAWMHDYSMRMMKEGGANFIRWGHCATSAANVRFSDKYGIAILQPGVDGESDAAGGAWTVRANAFRDVLIYFRNNPSIIIWEGGNEASLTSPAHLGELQKLYQTWDPAGKRAFAFRRGTPAKAQYFNVSIGTQGANDVPSLPVVEGEYNRMESPRRVWDAQSPPFFGYKPASAVPGYSQDSEQAAIYQVSSWAWMKSPGHCGGANWHFTDEPTHRRVTSEVARDSGEVDAVRLPKEGYFAIKAMWSATPQVHIVGHWTYPANTTKTVSVISNCDTVELLVNGQSIGKDAAPTNSYLFQFPGVKWQPGTIKAVCYRGGVKMAEQEKKTAGDPVRLRLTPTVAPGGWRADGADIAMIDVEVVDKDGNRCPNDQGRVDFAVTGPGVWRGGYNSGKEGSVNNTYLDLEAGLNRVFVRSTATPGAVTVTVKRNGGNLMPDTLTLQSVPVAAAGGLSKVMPATLPWTPQGGPSLPDPGPNPDAGAPDPDGGTGPSAEFQAIYDDILKPRCSSCHKATGAPAGLAMPDAPTAFANLVNVRSGDACMTQLRVAPRDADMSLLIKKLSTMPSCGAQMPKGCKPGDAVRPCLTDAEVLRIRSWIEGGAQ